jgi:hypothetical protein
MPPRARLYDSFQFLDTFHPLRLVPAVRYFSALSTRSRATILFRRLDSFASIPSAGAARKPRKKAVNKREARSRPRQATFLRSVESPSACPRITASLIRKGRRP